MREAIPFPDRSTEFEIQAQLYWELKNLGLTVRGEIELGNFSRPDLIVYSREKTPLAFIECKNYKGVKDWSKVSVWFTKNNQQGKSYRSHGLPVFQCISLGHVPFVVKAVIAEVGL